MSGRKVASCQCSAHTLCCPTHTLLLQQPRSDSKDSTQQGRQCLQMQGWPSAAGWKCVTCYSWIYVMLVTCPLLLAGAPLACADIAWLCGKQQDCARWPAWIDQAPGLLQVGLAVTAHNTSSAQLCGLQYRRPV